MQKKGKSYNEGVVYYTVYVYDAHVMEPTKKVFRTLVQVSDFKSSVIHAQLEDVNSRAVHFIAYKKRYSEDGDLIEKKLEIMHRIGGCKEPF